MVGGGWVVVVVVVPPVVWPPPPTFPPAAICCWTTWASSGELVVVENVSRGLDEAAGALCRLMSGATTRKTVGALDDGKSA